MTTCGATPGGPDTTGVDLNKQAIINGVIQRNQTEVSNAYVRLLDSTGEFAAEVPTNKSGIFRFFASPGEWKVLVLAPGVREERSVSVNYGTPAELVINLK